MFEVDIPASMVIPRDTSALRHSGLIVIVVQQL